MNATHAQYDRRVINLITGCKWVMCNTACLNPTKARRLLVTPPVGRGGAEISCKVGVIIEIRLMIIPTSHQGRRYSISRRVEI